MGGTVEESRQRREGGPARRRVAFVLPSFAGGGAERVLLTLAAALDPALFAPEIVVLDGAGPWRSLVPERIPVTDLGRNRIRGALLPLVRALRRSGAEIAVSTIGSLNLALLAVKPLLPARMRVIVREANTPHRHARGSAAARFYRWAYPRLYRRAAAVIVPASYLARELAEEFGVPREKIVILYNPVDTAALAAAAKPPVRAPGAGLRFVALGRLTHQKGFDRLLEMMAAAPRGAHLTILGDGPDRAALEAQRRELDLTDRVAMPGFAGDAARHVAGADALLLPSRWEGLPNVALEALALGAPVIATPEAGGIGEIASLAPAGAVTLAKAGDEFVAAMGRVAPVPPGTQRTSLLPRNFHLEYVAARFAELLNA
jgi:glycosyltransferase involved in cell wall biosynthesis